MTAAEAQRKLTEGGAVLIVLPSAQLPDGARVDVTIGDVTASGTIATRALQWSRFKGVNTIPVVLDGTGQLVEAPASAVSPSSERSEP